MATGATTDAADNKGNGRYFPIVDILRFSAALLVTGYHLTFWWWLPEVTGPNSTQLLDAGSIFHFPFRWGFVGVQIFFVISGFVIALTAEGRNVRQFLRSRVMRLYPAAWVCAPITAVVLWSQGRAFGGELARSMALSPIGSWVDGVYWTLGVEIVFYLLVAVSLWTSINIRSVARFLTVWSGGYFAVRALNLVLGGPLDALFAMHDQSPLSSLFLWNYGVFFAFGIFLYLWTTARFNRADFAFLAICLLGILANAHQVARAALREVGHAAPWEQVVPAIIIVAAILILVVGLRLNDRLVNSTWALSQPLRTLGLMTYPLYLIHSVVGGALIGFCAVYVEPIYAIVVGLALMLLLSNRLLILERKLRHALARVWTA